MSEILVDNLTGKTSAGDITVTSEGGAATQSLQQGLAKAWFHFDQTGTPAIDDSLNVSSLDDDGTAQATINYTNNMSGSHYAVAGDHANLNAGSTMRSMNFHTSTTSNVEMDGWYISTGSASQQDAVDNKGIVMGDLA